ncbi:D-alanyl-lipoteichoic acid acyltransferase DltB, MBOAT superfamily [Thermosyntropha lipolytica DSM 11003]|uniref:D-alanyl-lipoteichoic acid acyltransferase DltB, MBOAT superfamily n=1 Tax=Thermosyntropha lipolytica DSM 11003 TaxID=1123382 RepID=A0A1M5JWF1_9FIRM|nr:MBOAT family protein [Thermosyntropha lipolytica]SHG44868.1 D-alanyl-lipoteichoic acid acyltransferase DltB, MBOAT superfamily [Thermosyntropha lipolytica DSM 11003]
MLFNSYVYIFAFLPAAFAGYFLLAFRYEKGAKLWLVLASLFFYSYWNIRYLPLILVSLGVNFILGRKIGEFTGKDKEKARLFLIAGLLFNIGLLGYYKYADFFLSNINYLLRSNLPLLHIALPLAISFFTFQQIAYIVDAYRGEAREYDLLNYALFITFFPQLIAGPIVHHKEMMPQFRNERSRYINYENMAKGLFIFCIGLFKKVMVADTFAYWANWGFDGISHLTFFEAWITSLAYTFQLYFDFSGYTDMAIGAALFFNIKLPVNFNSPYKSLDIQEFWRRWHMTLSRFLRDYIYIPLGGNRRGEVITYRNLMITFLIGGLWHGAGWNFVFWGFLHGAALIIHRLWRKTGIKMPSFLAWLITFNFVNAGWVFFRAQTFDDALKVLKGMAGLNGVLLPANLEGKLPLLDKLSYPYGSFTLQNTLEASIYITLALLAVLLLPNSVEMKDRLQPKLAYALLAGFLAFVSILHLTNVTQFLYFNF